MSENRKKLSEEMLLRAMDYLDDALIEEAEAFRSGKSAAAPAAGVPEPASESAAGPTDRDPEAAEKMTNVSEFPGTRNITKNRYKKLTGWAALLAACVGIAVVLGRTGVLDRPFMTDSGGMSAPAAPAPAEAAPAEAEESAATAPAEAAAAAAEAPAAPVPAPASVPAAPVPETEEAHTLTESGAATVAAGGVSEPAEEAAAEDIAPEPAPEPASAESARRAEKAAAASESLQDASNAAAEEAEEPEETETMETILFADGASNTYRKLFLSAEETERLGQSIGDIAAEQDGVIWYEMEGVNSDAFLIRKEETESGAVYSLWERQS